MFRQLLTIAGNTYVEAIRQPVFAVLLLVGVLGMILNVNLAAYTLDADNKLMIDLGLSTIFVVGLLVAAFTATGVVSEEIENRTALTVVSKPVPRPVFIVGKYLGVAAALGLANVVLCLSFLMTLRHGVQQTASDHVDFPVVLLGFGAVLGAIAFAAWTNFHLRWVFTSTFAHAVAIGGALAYALMLFIDKEFQLQSPLAEFDHDDFSLVQVMIGLVLLFEAQLLLAAVAVAVSTRLGQVVTILISAGVFFVGLIGNSLNAITDKRLDIPAGVGLFRSFWVVITAEVPVLDRILFVLAKGLYLVLPNLQFLWNADAITEGNPITLGYVATCTLYTAMYTLAVLAIAVLLFQRREVG
jgi:ABC-type transport system involved in multi-copper enzyme maturation permease subunit